MKAKTCIYASLTVFLLIACAQNGSGQLTVHSGLKPGSAQQNQQQGMPGTNNQTTQDVTTAPEYQQYIAPLGQKIASFNEFSLPDEENVSASSPSRMTDFFERIAKGRKWVLVDFKSLGQQNNQTGSGRMQLVPSQVQNGNQNQNNLNNQNNNNQNSLSGTFQYDDQKYIKITKTTVYLNSAYYNSLGNDAKSKSQLELHALVAQLYISQNETATDLLNRMATVDPQVRNDKTVQEAKQQDQNGAFDPGSGPSTGPSSVDYQAINNFRTFLDKNTSTITADSLYTEVKTDFPGGAANFARPYIYKHGTSASSTATSTDSTAAENSSTTTTTVP